MSEDLTLKIDLNAPVTLASCAGALRSFFTWWIQQLAGLLPTSWQAKLHAFTYKPRLIIEGDSWRFEDLGAKPLVLDAQAPPYELQEEIFRKYPLALTHSIDVVLPRTDGLFKRIALPRAAASRLKQVVRLQIDRLSPFRGDDVHFDCSLVPFNEDQSCSATAGPDDILVEVAVLPKRRLLAIEQKLRAAGLVPRSFCLAGTSASFSPHGLPWSKQTQSRILLAAVGMLLGTVAFLLGPTLNDSDIADLRAEIDTVAPRVQRAQAEREELFKYQLPLQAASPDRAAVLDALVDLTKRFPDTAYVSLMEVSGTHVKLRGSVPAALNVETVLAQSPVLSHTRVNRGGPDGNTFTATAMLKPLSSGER